MGKIVKMSFEGKSQQELANGQNIDYSEKKKEENGQKASSAPALGLNTIIFKYVYYTPGIYADGYIVFAFPFVRSYVR